MPIPDDPWSPPMPFTEPLGIPPVTPPRDTHDPLRTIAFTLPRIMTAPEPEFQAWIQAVLESDALETELDTAKRIIAVLVHGLGGTVTINPHDVYDRDGALVFESDPLTAHVRIRYHENTKETPA